MFPKCVDTEFSSFVSEITGDKNVVEDEDDNDDDVGTVGVSGCCDGDDVDLRWFDAHKNLCWSSHDAVENCLIYLFTVEYPRSFISGCRRMSHKLAGCI